MAKLIAPLDTHTVYAVVHPDYKSVYYGVTSQKLEDRFSHHMQALERGYHGNKELQEAYEQHPKGWTVHRLAKLPFEEADALERMLIEGDTNCFNKQKNPRKRGKATKVTDDVVAAVMSLIDSMYQYQIARHLGISSAEVSKISRGKHSLQVSA
jgi:hypothetical protein